MNSNSTTANDLSGLSREELLRLVSLQQSQLRSTQQQQVQLQQQLRQQPQASLSSLNSSRLLGSDVLGTSAAASALNRTNNGLFLNHHGLDNIFTQGSTSTVDARMAELLLLRNQGVGVGLTGGTSIAAGFGGANAARLAAGGATASDLLHSDLLQTRSRLAASASLGSGGLLGGGSSLAALELLQARARLSSSAASTGLRPSVEELLLRQEAAQAGRLPSVQELLLRQELLAGAAGASSATGRSPANDAPAQRRAGSFVVSTASVTSNGSANGTSVASGNNTSAGKGKMPAPGSEEDLIISRMLMADPEHAAAAADAARNAAASGSDSVAAKPSTPTNSSPHTATTTTAAKKTESGRKSKKTKRPLSAYNIYFKEEHAKIIALKEEANAKKREMGEVVSSDEEFEDDEDDIDEDGKPRKRRKILSTNQPGKRGKRQTDFEGITKVIGKRWKQLPKERVDEYKRRAEEAMQEYRQNLFMKIRNSVKEDQV